jgi:hypothetical protein
MPINSFLYPGAKFIPGYEVANSLRFNYDSSDYLNKTLGTATNRKIFTISMWVKRSELYGVNSETKYLMSAGNNASTNIDEFYFRHDTLDFSGYESSTTEFQLRTNQLFRDVSSWYHIVVAYDSTQGTASNRIKMYANGSQITSFSTETYPDQNHEPLFNSNIAHEIGRNTDARYFDGYITEVVFIDGQALDPTSFGEFDEDSPNIWKPKNVSGLTFGTNGFYLDFENASSLGADVSGNSNNFTVNNLASIDQSTDTCTNNFATMNPIAPANISSASDGNLKILQSSSGGSVISTFGFSNGKWYWEVKLDSQVNYTQLAGVIKESKMESALLTSFNVGANDGGWGYFLQGNTDNGKAFHNNSASSVYTTMSAGNILSIAVDSDNGKIYFAVNGTYVNSGDPANGTGAVYTNLPTGENLFPAITNYVGDGSTATLLMNFGSPSFSISSGNSDANGYGNFEYAVPSGFYALNTKNLAEFG